MTEDRDGTGQGGALAVEVERGYVLICCEGGDIRAACGSDVRCGKRGIKDDPRCLA